MYELIVIACLIAQPARCEEFHLPLEGGGGVMQCMRVGQLQLVRWTEEHAGWVVRRWRCDLPRA